MGKEYTEIDERLQKWMGRQQMFFVATAPLSGDGLVNVSPKGLDGTLVVLDETTVAYLDLMGSELTVTSTPGEGSTFAFDINLPPAHAELSAAAVSEGRSCARASVTAPGRASC